MSASIEKLREARASVWDQMEALMATAEQASRDLTTEERAQYDQLEAEFTDRGNALAHAEKRERARASINDLGDGRDPGPIVTPAGQDRAPRSLGEHFAKEIGDKLQAIHTTDSRWSVAAPEFYNAATDTVVTGGNTGGLGPVLTQVDTNIVLGLRRQLTIADLLSSGTLTGQAITYFVEGAMEGGFATVAENATKPQMNFVNPTAVTEALKKIAGYIKESDEMIEDLPFLVSAINNRLLYNLGLFEEDQVLNGNGTGTNLRGLLQRSGVQAIGTTADAKTGNPDQIFKAMTAVSTATGLNADGIVINPLDYQAFRLAKDANNQYYGGGFFAGQYGVGGVPEQPPLWGLRTVVTPAIAAGTVAVGAFRAAATLYRKGGVRVEATNSDQADFINNRVTIRAEERVALAVRVPSAIAKVTLGTA